MKLKISALTATPLAVRWIVLLVLSVGISLALSAAGLPAALLLGPMAAGIVFGVNGIGMEVPPAAYVGAQGAIGAMVAASVTPAIAATLGQHYVLLCAVVIATLFGATALGWVISRAGWIPGPTAIYGISPGAASVMVVLAEAEGADARMVAFMQYARVLMVALGTALVARLWPGVVTGHVQVAGWFDPVDWSSLAIVVLIAILAQQAARLLRVQAWAVLGPMFLLSALHAGGWLPIALPRWLLAAAYCLIGWRIGLGFRREELIYARKALPAVIGAAVLLMAFCSLLACCLAQLANVDALTAYLATSPGGLDSVAIIAASTPGTDLSFVLALQTVRLLLVIGFAPMIARFVVRRSGHLRVGGDG